jgi:uncharacterized protein
MQLFRPKDRRRPLRLCLAAAGALPVIAAFCIALPPESLARRSGHQRITFAVVGDSIANELGQGMQSLYRRSSRVRVLKKTKFSTGLVRTDYYNWYAVLPPFLRYYRPDVIAVNIGGNDRQNLFVDGRRLERFSRPWLRAYENRVARFMTLLKRSGAKVYWVGLPQVRSQRMTRDYWTLNRIYRREAERHGFIYVSIWDKYADSRGGYTAYGRAVDGHTRRLRKTDGIHFTDAGKLRLAVDVADAMGLR